MYKHCVLLVLIPLYVDTSIQRYRYICLHIWIIVVTIDFRAGPRKKWQQFVKTHFVHLQNLTITQYVPKLHRWGITVNYIWFKRFLNTWHWIKTYIVCSNPQWQKTAQTTNRPTLTQQYWTFNSTAEGHWKHRYGDRLLPPALIYIYTHM